MSEDKEPNRFEKRIQQREQKSSPNRFQRRLARVRQAREQEVSPQKRAIAAGIAAAVAALTLYTILASLGVYSFDWRFLAFAGVVGFAAGLFFGAKRLSEGAAAGVLAGVWIFLEIFVAGFLLVFEAMAVALAAIFSAFSL